jgi:amidohydrolase
MANNPDKQLLQQLITIRRQLHQYPEIGYQEFKTSQLVASELSKAGIPFDSAVADTKTGIIATLKKGAGPTIVLRADMDALPMQEKTSLSFSSVHENVMHACGHDVHTTMLLGAALVLKDTAFNGCVQFVFQPSEEGNYDDPEKKSGGQRIIESGLLDGASAALALHVHPLLAVGKIAYTMGQALACVNFFRIEIKGKAGHAGAAPELAIDAIVIAAQVIQAVQTIISRNISPVEPGVISITTISGGGKENIIADSVILKGTIRALSKAVYDSIINRLKEMLAGIAVTFKAQIDFEITLEYPSLLNDPAIHQVLEKPLSGIFQQENVLAVAPLMGGEDFAFYSRKIPSMFYFLGARDEAEEAYFVHHPSVIINEDCIEKGVDFLTKSALRLLENCPRIN